jgi:hypothetical protein
VRHLDGWLGAVSISLHLVRPKVRLFPCLSAPLGVDALSCQQLRWHPTTSPCSSHRRRRCLSLFWALVFFGQIFLCLMWAPISAFTMLVITPSRRATAQGVNLLARCVRLGRCDACARARWALTRTEAVAGIPLRFYPFHLRFLAPHHHVRARQPTSHLLGDAASPIIIGAYVDWKLGGHGCQTKGIERPYRRLRTHQRRGERSLALTEIYCFCEHRHPQL